MVVLLGALALFAVIALVLRARNGRFAARTGKKVTRTGENFPRTGENFAAPPLAEYAVGERATLVQFSSAFCAPCRATRRTLTEISDVVPGVAHVEVDAESQLDLVRRLNILRTPTTLVLDATGTEISRASGAPTKPQVLQALAHALPE